MHCPFCRHTDSRVVDSRATDDGTAIRRRRQCPECSRRFTTVETAALTVVKRSGASEPFSRDKVLSGVRKACQGRPVTEDDLARLAQQVEEAVRGTGAAEIDAHEVGLTILPPLRELDEVAYLRFASGLPLVRVARGLRGGDLAAPRRARGGRRRTRTAGRRPQRRSEPSLDPTVGARPSLFARAAVTCRTHHQHHRSHRTRPTHDSRHRHQDRGKAHERHGEGRARPARSPRSSATD